MLIEMVNILGPIILITLVGYFLGRSSVGLESNTVSSLVILIATPALVFNTLASADVDSDVVVTMSGAALFCVGLAMVISLVLLKWSKASVRSYLPSLAFPNSGNMGLPVVVLTFGPESTKLAVAYFFVVALFQNSVGLSISAGTMRFKELAKQPLLYSVFIVLLVSVTNFPVPQVILTTTEMLGGMMIPAMLILLGTSLATLKIGDLSTAVSMAVARLLIGIVTGLIVIKVMNLSGMAAGAVFLLSAMPSAVVTYVFAERFQQNGSRVAGAVVMSTLLTFVCLPALVWGALEISKLDRVIAPSVTVETGIE